MSEILPQSEPARVSVIIPAYNYGRYLAEAIQSALDQDYPSIEVIVCDDGSTDNTPAVLASFGDRIKIVHGEHRGVSAARNAALKRASGEFIAFLDADDAWYPTKIRCQVEALMAHPKAGLCHTGSELFGADSGDGPIEGPRRARIQGSCFADLFQANGIVMSSAIVRASVIPSAKFYEDLVDAEDLAMFLQILFVHEAVYLPQVLTRYRKHDTQATSDGSRRMQIQVGLARLRALDQFGDRMAADERQTLLEFALKQLHASTYSRYWIRDWPRARKGFCILRERGVPVPWRHRFRAWLGMTLRIG